MEAGRYIEAPRQVRRHVAKLLGITDGAMSHALSYRRSGDKSTQAREMVLAHEDAKIYRYLPECETIHDADGTMSQWFASGVELIAYKDDNRVELWRDGKLLASYYDVTIARLSLIQREAANL